ncbi:hypothetical protein ZIOFF_053098 [Zingiber officinale]|uniref:Uncharacterized protein n=1 Tax=Zingiber officinale TaxID=94328 RepID=A0A8J5KI86_ZINOF|nr:hypothetical protein ZIOFF_053098 [Zingiber officinale]
MIADAAGRSILRSPCLRGAASRSGSVRPSLFRSVPKQRHPSAAVRFHRCPPAARDPFLSFSSLRKINFFRIVKVPRRGELLCGIDVADAQCHGFCVDDVDAHDFAQGLWVAVGRFVL